MKLKYTEKKVFEVDYNDLNDFFESIYGYDPDIICTEEWGNDQSHSFTIKKEKLGRYEQKDLKTFKATGEQSYGITYLLLRDCCNNGLIPEGEYLVDVSW